MIRIYFLLVLFYLFSIVCSGQELEYPLLEKGSVVNNYFGTLVADPYRHLEEPESEISKEWLKAESKLTKSYFDRVTSKYYLNSQMRKNSFVNFGTLRRSGKYFFELIVTPPLKGAKLYIKDKLNHDGIIIVDPEDYKGIPSIKNFEVSPDNKYLAFSLSYKGSDWREIRIKKIFPRRELSDTLQWVKFSSIKWKDEGFYYIRYPEVKKSDKYTKVSSNPMIFYHRLDTYQSEDILIYHNSKANFSQIDFDVFENGRYMIIYTDSIFNGKPYNYILVRDFLKPQGKFEKLWAYPKNEGGIYSIVGCYRNQFLIQTNAKAPRGKMILINPEFPHQTQNYVPEYLQTLDEVHIAGDKVVGTYLKDMDYSAVVFDSLGKAKLKIECPIGSSIEGFDHMSSDSTILFYYYSFLYPPIVHELNIRSFKTKLVDQTVVNYDFNKFEMRKVFCRSKDSTLVPLLIACKKNFQPTGKTPTILYGYGGYGINQTPFYDNAFISHLENNGIIVMACIRGGGEYGEEWHSSGAREKKQNSFDDFIAAADYLVQNEYTSRSKLALMGGSNGGLLVAAVVNQRPDICQVAIPMVGVYDMLRYQKYTAGKASESEFGTSEDSLQFKYLIKYSPLHNVNEHASYPAMLFITSDHDDRVVPMHTYKMVATLQEKNLGVNPILLIVNKDGGHSYGSIELDSKIYSFIYENMGIPPSKFYFTGY